MQDEALTEKMVCSLVPVENYKDGFIHNMDNIQDEL
jgi:hypothetical protein